MSNPFKYPTIYTLDEIIIDNSSPSDDQVENNRHKQPDPNRGSVASFRTVHANLGPVGHSTRLPGHTIANHTNIPHKDDSLEQIDDRGPEDPALQLSKH